MSNIEWLDYAIIISFFLISLLIGLRASRTAGKSSEEFFLSGRNMPWWLLGVSMVATTFAADTPGLVAQLVRENGVFGNWVWWAQLLTGVVTVIFFARLWRKSGINTDLEFYELRYSGKPASFLRGFRAIYLGVVFNVITMGGVCLAGAKIADVVFGMDQLSFVLIAGSITVVYSMLGGLKGVLLTDFFQFLIAMVGSVWATYYIINLPEIGGVQNVLESVGNNAVNPMPDFSSESQNWYGIFVIPLAVVWWSTWYPGAEPGGGGYVAQRMLAAKDEKHATKATLFFVIAHYALRPWPWILIGLASIMVFPDIASIQAEFPNATTEIAHDTAYSAMIAKLPTGLIGLVLASLIAAFMSTISTQLNWGSSYIVNDFYKRFVKPDSTPKEDVWVGRISTFLLMLLAALLSFFYKDAKMVFNALLLIGAGTGLIYILRWFWRRINAWSEIAAMISSFVIGLFFTIWNAYHEDNAFESVDMLLMSVGLTTLIWLIVTLVTSPESDEVINKFESKVFSYESDSNSEVIDDQSNGSVNKFKNFGWKILGFFLTVLGIYAVLFAIGYAIFGMWSAFSFAAAMAIVSSFVLYFKRKEVFFE